MCEPSSTERDHRRGASLSQSPAGGMAPKSTMPLRPWCQVEVSDGRSGAWMSLRSTWENWKFWGYMMSANTLEIDALEASRKIGKPEGTPIPVFFRKGVRGRKSMFGRGIEGGTDRAEASLKRSGLFSLCKRDSKCTKFTALSTRTVTWRLPGLTDWTTSFF